MEATDLIKALLEGFKEVAKTETIIGEGIKAGEFTVLPVSKVSLGIGAGAGTEHLKTTGGSGGAGGGGICVEPIAFLVIKDGEVSILNLRRMPAMVEAFFGRIPDLMEKAVNIVRGKRRGEGAEAR
ncbi:MAG: sporulation protein [Syntrophaceae bacterium]|nr:sporulation protein [Syntrophaceae bacterium]